MGSRTGVGSSPPEVWARAAKRHGYVFLFYGLIFKIRGLLMVPLILVMTLCTRYEYEHDIVNWTLGLTVFAGGLALRVASQRYLKYRLRLSEPQLATDGIYAHVRNPVYIANSALLVGLALLCELYWMIPIVILWTATVYSLAVRFEEVRLARMFGDAYAEYCRRVPRWLPRLRPESRSNVGTSATWLRSLAVEYQCALLLLLPIWKEVFWDPGR